jgi:O-antigen ligase
MVTAQTNDIKQSYSIWFVKALRLGIGLILIIAPFYITLAIWSASVLHHLDLFKIWKELALAIMGLIILVFLICQRGLAKRSLKSPLIELSLAYIFLILLIGLFDLLTHRVSRNAIIYGWLIDVRPVGFFLVTYLSFAISNQRKVPAINWKKLVLVPAALVMIFGFLQMTVLPKDILKHVGYNSHTTTPYQTVDNQPDIVRIQSTTRGPNPLGAYDLLIILALSVLLISAKAKKPDRIWLGILFIISLVVLFGTYSRSAEIGVVLSWLSLLAIYQRHWLSKHLYLALGALAIVVLVGLAAAEKHNYFLQNVFFHSSNRSTSAVSSNAQRSQALKTATEDVLHHPLGGGIGSAGPASRRNTQGPVKLAENNYLQIGQEAGIVGMALFIAIIIAIGRELWHRRHQQLALILLTSLVGLSFVNLLSHAWTDDTLAYVWWGLAGIALAPAILTDKYKRNNGQKIQKSA